MKDNDTIKLTNSLTPAVCVGIGGNQPLFDLQKFILPCCTKTGKKLIVWIRSEEEYDGPYPCYNFSFAPREKIDYISKPGVIDCVLNTALEAIQGKSDPPMKILA